MSSLSNKVGLVFGHGLDVEIARRLAQSFKLVYYHAAPCERAFQTVRECCIGWGLEGSNVVRTARPLSPQMLSEVDCWVFPDLLHSDKQQLLESLGKAVWGSRQADELELDREKFLTVLEQTGLHVPEHHICHGLTELTDYLVDKEDQYVKLSRFRADMETKHWRDWSQDNGWLRWMGVKLGPFSDILHFLVFPAIKTDLELGGDSYNVRGAWPKTMLNGLEAKDKSYFAAVTPVKEMPVQIQEIMEAFGPVLGRFDMRNQWSMEARVKGDVSSFIDPTPRLGLPSSASQMALWTNFPEIIYAGAHGELIEPEFENNFSMEVAVCASGHKETWTDIKISDDVRERVMFGGFCQVDDIISFPPDDSGDSEVGWLHAQGKTPRETLERLKEYAEALPEGLTVNLASIVEIIDEVESAESKGIPITEAPMPDPVEVL